MMAHVIGKTIADGQNRYRLHADGSWSTLMFGAFPHQKQPGLIWRWVNIPETHVPERVKKAAR